MNNNNNYHIKREREENPSKINEGKLVGVFGGSLQPSQKTAHEVINRIDESDEALILRRHVEL